MKKPAIIFVDDETSIKESFEIGLSRLLDTDIQLFTAQNGIDAYELYLQLVSDQYDIFVVVTDQKMPKMDGDELLKKIYEVSPLVKGILITGFLPDGIINDLKTKSNLHCIISKPCRIDYLSGIINKVFAEYKFIRTL